MQFHNEKIKYFASFSGLAVELGFRYGQTYVLSSCLKMELDSSEDVLFIPAMLLGLRSEIK